MTQDLRPNWGTYKNYLKLSVLEFVALYGVRIDPKHITYSGGRIENFPPTYQGWMVDGQPAPTEFKDMLDLAERNIINSQNVLPNSHHIPRSECDTWALSWDWGILDEMKVNEAMRSKTWLWGSHETKLLAYLADAATEFWSRYDPSDSTKAPTNIQVQNWLMERNVP